MKIKTSPTDWSLLIIRVGLGLIVLYFGCQKMLGMFGGGGISGTVKAFEGMGYNPVLTYLAIAAEFFGALGILVGLLTRVAALGVLVTMLVATSQIAKTGALSQLSTPGSQAANHLFFPLGLAFMALAIIISGPGSLALDSFVKFAKPKKS